VGGSFHGSSVWLQLGSFTLRSSCFFTLMAHQPYRQRLCHSSGSHQFPTTAAWVQAQVRLCGICGGQGGTGAGFLRIRQFPLLILIPPTTPHSSSSIMQGWYNRTNSGRRTKWTQPHTSPRKKKDTPNKA
jgi:hypothetical protein